MLLVSWRSWRSLLRREVRQRGRRLLLRRILFVGIRRGHLCLPCVGCWVMAEDKREMGRESLTEKGGLAGNPSRRSVFGQGEITKKIGKFPSEHWKS